MSRNTSFWDIGDMIFEIIRYLLNQATAKNIYLLTNLWALASVVILSLFSGAIYTSIVNKEMKTINTYEELINSNITLVSGNDSFLYHSIKWVHHNKYSKFIQLKPKVQFEDDFSSVSHLK